MTHVQDTLLQDVTYRAIVNYVTGLVRQSLRSEMFVESTGMNSSILSQEQRSLFPFEDYDIWDRVKVSYVSTCA
jgi:hypothetical protein